MGRGWGRSIEHRLDSISLTQGVTSYLAGRPLVACFYMVHELRMVFKLLKSCRGKRKEHDWVTETLSVLQSLKYSSLLTPDPTQPFILRE